MLKDYNKYKVMKLFLYNSTESFRLRELSRLVGVAPMSVGNYLLELFKEGIIREYKKNSVRFYTAQRDSLKFIRYQKLSIQYELYASGVIDEIWGNLHPEAIILYGSYVKGEATENSDIDLFVMCKEKPFNLEKYEKQLGKKIHLLFKMSNKIPNELKNNLANGIVMAGYFKIE